MPWLIDAANLGGVLGGARGARNAEAILAALLPWARGRKQVVVVFDGPERPEMATHLGGVEIVWSGARTADEVITQRVAALAKTAKAAKAWTVVTNDNGLARRCRDHGSKVESASIFARRAAEPAQPSAKTRGAPAAEKPAPTAREIAHWQEVFGEKKKLQ